MKCPTWNVSLGSRLSKAVFAQSLLCIRLHSVYKLLRLGELFANDPYAITCSSTFLDSFFSKYLLMVGRYSVFS